MFRRIVAAIDPSHLEHGTDILRNAQGLLADGGEIVVVGVIEEMPAYVAPQLPAGMVEKALTRAQADLEALVERIGVPAVVLVETGHAWRTITEEAERRGADLIVVRSHRPEFADMILGTNAGQVVRHADCSVLVLR